MSGSSVKKERRALRDRLASGEESTLQVAREVHRLKKSGGSRSTRRLYETAARESLGLIDRSKVRDQSENAVKLRRAALENYNAQMAAQKEKIAEITRVAGPDFETKFGEDVKMFLSEPPEPEVTPLGRNLCADVSISPEGGLVISEEPASE